MHKFSYVSATLALTLTRFPLAALRVNRGIESAQADFPLLPAEEFIPAATHHYCRLPGLWNAFPPAPLRRHYYRAASGRKHWKAAHESWG
jgi:hypothetical protein